MKDEPDYDRTNQSATSYSVKGFDNALIIDNRNLFFIRSEIENILQIEPGQSLK